MKFSGKINWEIYNNDIEIKWGISKKIYQKRKVYTSQKFINYEITLNCYTFKLYFNKNTEHVWYDLFQTRDGIEEPDFEEFVDINCNAYD